MTHSHSTKPSLSRLRIAGAVLLALSFSACQKTGKTDSKSLDGTYTAALPCADCAAIHAELSLLEADRSYSLKLRYEGKGETTEETKGSWVETPERIVILNGVKDAPNRYRIEEGALRQLDTKGNPIEGPIADQYLFRKKTN
jgi:copper homeostasis protein (lipoprotein)